VKPTKVRQVKDAALYAQRIAKYDADLIVYQKAMAEYKSGQRVREAEKQAGKRKVSEAAASAQQGEHEGAAVAALAAPRGQSPAPKPAPKESQTADRSNSKRQKLAPRPTARQLAAAVIPGTFSMEVRDHVAFTDCGDPSRLAKQTEWVEDIARFAEQAGVLTAPLLWPYGAWCAPRHQRKCTMRAAPQPSHAHGLPLVCRHSRLVAGVVMTLTMRTRTPMTTCRTIAWSRWTDWKDTGINRRTRSLRA
jgi:hypothetical protein